MRKRILHRVAYPGNILYHSDHISTPSILSWILCHSLTPILYISRYSIQARYNLSFVIQCYAAHYSMIETMYSLVCSLDSNYVSGLSIGTMYPFRSLGLCTHYVLIETMYSFFPSLGPYHSSYVTPSYSITETMYHCSVIWTFLSNSAIRLTEDPKFTLLF